MTDQLDNESEKQIVQCLHLLKDILGKDLLGVYLYGSAVVGGLQKYSDLDLFVVSNRSTTYQEKTKLVKHLLAISGVYMKSSKRSIEMIIVVKSEINPWRYPPKFDFLYGDWLRKEFENGNIEPWPTKEISDIALLITQVLLANKKLWGATPDQLLDSVPYRDFMIATMESLSSLMADLNRDTRNVLLTLCRIWSTVKTDTIRSKPDAATWAIHQLPEEYHPVIKRALAICVGEENEHWDDMEVLIQPCANFILSRVNAHMSLLELSHCVNKSIKLAQGHL